MASPRREVSAKSDDALIPVVADVVVSREYGMEITLAQEELTVSLCADPRRFETSTSKSYWHNVEKINALKVTVQSTEERVRLVRLAISGSEYNWNPKWPRWSFARRRLPIDYSGDAIAAQDQTTEDDTELLFLMLPGEIRTATLEFVAPLEDSVVEGNYPFQIVATDTAEPSLSAKSFGMLKLRHPDAAMLNYLPAIYQQTRQQSFDTLLSFNEKPFFERFLRGFEDASEPSKLLLNNVSRFFDVQEAPSDFIPWLATWVGLIIDENWPELRRRLLIKEAVELYRWRGTRRGLARYLQIYTGYLPLINDTPYRGMSLGPATLLGQETATLGGVPTHSFIVTIAVPNPESVNETTIRDIIESDKPAHAAYEVRILEQST